MNTALTITATYAALLATGCPTSSFGGAPAPMIICHNSNCAGETDPDRDDTIDALTESLAQTYGTRPVVDGVEIDLIWSADQSRCIFGHDLATHADGPDAALAAAVVADHLVNEPVPSSNGQRFYVKVELKAEVSVDTDVAVTTEHLEAHARCALEVVDIIEQAATENGHALSFYFEATDHARLYALRDDPAWPGRTVGGQIEFLFTSGHVALPPMEDFPVDMVWINVPEIHDGYASQFGDSVDIMLGMYDATVETFHAIDELAPQFLNTNEAPLMRRYFAGQR
jgi:hypothetical protein